MDAVIFFLELALLGVIVSFGYSRYKLDKFRSSLFELRNELFDLVLNNDKKLKFDSSEYRDVEATINSTIRFAEMISLFQLVFLSWSLRREKSGIYAKLLTEKRKDPLHDSKLDPTVLDQLKRMKKKSEYLWAKQLLFAKFSTATIVCLGAATFVFGQLFKRGIVGLKRVGFRTAESKIIGRTENYFRNEMLVVSRGR